MTSAAAIPIEHKPDGPPPPRWDDVPFDVECPRCGFDLHGSKASSCSRCGLGLDWAQLVPLDELRCECGYALRGLPNPRCPECGSAFDWNQTLQRHRSRRKLLFEYCWRRRPLRSYVRSLYLSLRPWRLWREIDIHDPPEPRAAAGMIAVTIVLATVVASGMGLLSQLLEWLAARAAFRGSAAFVPPFALSWADATEWVQQWHAGVWHECTGSYYPPSFVIFVVFAALGVWGALMVLRQSMRRSHVKAAHVFRVYSYMFLPLPVFLFLMAMWCPVVPLLLELWKIPRYGPPGFFGDPFPQTCLSLMLGFWMFLSLRLGYRRYLRMRHSWLIAAAASTIGILLGACTTVIVYLVERF